MIRLTGLSLRRAKIFKNENFDTFLLHHGRNRPISQIPAIIKQIGGKILIFKKSLHDGSEEPLEFFPEFFVYIFQQKTMFFAGKT